MELIAVVMGCETSAKRFAACKSMLDYGFANYALAQAELPGQMTVPVKLGTADTVKVMPKEKNELLVDKAQRNQVNITTQLPDSIDAPVSKGQKIGTVTVRVGDQVVSEVPLLAEEAVPKLSWWQMFLRILRRICMAK